MSLTSLWKSQKDELISKHVQAMVGLAGDGKLRDGGKACEEFREFLTNVPSALLDRYANECLGAEKFLEASSALQDVINEVGREEEKLQHEIEPRGEGEKKSSPVDFKEACLERLQKHFGIVLVKRSAALYSSANNKIGVICLNSRKYHKARSAGYWFGFRLPQKEAIEQYDRGYVTFGCGSPERIIAIPAKQLLSWLPFLNVTDNEGAFFWHIHISEEKNRYMLRTKEGNDPKDLTEFFLR